MKAAKVLRQDSWTCLEEMPDGGLRFSVLCGSVGLYEVRFRLNEAEVAAFKRQGNAYLDRLANRVLGDPKGFLGRQNEDRT